ncbi:MAG: acetyl-CoA C-acyltransferase [Sphingomonadales bacterium]|nr:acetyl-CoA C-acyltransferase [Sphingomonadales bacterium]
MKPVYVVDAIRTPVGRYGGSLSAVRPDDLLATVLRALHKRNDTIDPAAIEEVIAGAANQAGEDNRNVARMASLLAGLPTTVAGTTVNRLCASGLQAIMEGARQIACGDADLILAGGVESMSRAPYVMGKSAQPFDRSAQLFDTTMGWRFINPLLAERYHPYSMGETAENVAEQYKISREQQDLFALSSQQKYAAARKTGIWEQEITAVEIQSKGLISWVVDDEHPRETSIEKLAALSPVFKKNGTVTAGNSSGINDGAAGLLLAGEEALKKHKLTPIAKVVAMAVAGVDPALMGIGPVPATQKVMQRAGLSMQDIDLVELNEAFASQSLACMQELSLNPACVNVNGGSIAIGHPLGCSGARISTTLLYELRRRKARYGLATMCVGVGQGAAVVYEAL